MSIYTRQKFRLESQWGSDLWMGACPPPVPHPLRTTPLGQLWSTPHCQSPNSSPSPSPEKPDSSPTRVQAQNQVPNNWTSVDEDLIVVLYTISLYWKWLKWFHKTSIFNVLRGGGNCRSDQITISPIPQIHFTRKKFYLHWKKLLRHFTK